jgi:hypothetical protein
MWATGHNCDIRRAALATRPRARLRWLRIHKELAQKLKQRGPEPMSILQRLYDSEINFEVSGFYDAGFDVRLGDALNGFLAHGKVKRWADVEAWLRDQALAHYPESKFAQDELRAAQAH